ncbi:hypothetical protein ACHQM5_005812 [Ranunculus cassubicifolius]
MAKPRKPKNNEDQKPENSIAIVQHQKLCISIDMDNSRIYGYTELKVLIPESGLVGLHADNMTIESVTVDGEISEFKYTPRCQLVEEERRYSEVNSTVAASDAACSSYLTALENELSPNLMILCGIEVKEGSDQVETKVVVDVEAGNGHLVEMDSRSDAKVGSEGKLENGNENVKLIRIDYWIEKTETGIYFEKNVMHTNNQIRRARCWFPCMDVPSQQCPFDMEFTVAQNFVAVSNGTLLYQVLSKDEPPRKTFVYQLSVPVSAGWISLAVAQFEVLPDRHIGVISHMCFSPDFSKLRNTVSFFHGAFSHYEDYLSAPFPFGSYKQVFIKPEMAISSLSVGASMCIFSSQVLYDEKVIDQTIDTRIKLAYALARQWFGVYITAEGPNDEWLLDGLAGFLTDSFIKRFLGNNEARYRRYKANFAVCKADVSGAFTLSSTASTNLYGTQSVGLYGKIRSWKSVAILQMLEKQMGPESFRKILQVIILKAQDRSRYLRTLSTKEFRQFSNKVGNLERPFLKEFFPRWVGSCGCPVLRMGLSYNKRKNMIELAVLRGCTTAQDSATLDTNSNTDAETREGNIGWPGMMSIRVYELDGNYDHPILPMSGEDLQLVEIQCHSRLAAKRFQKPKKGSKPDGSDDNGDISTMDMRPNAESPLLWLRADPEMEYLAEIHFNQPIQMWINQLEKDKDVAAQAQAIASLEALPQLSFPVVNALYNFLSDSKAFWRVRIEAAFALAHTASEDTDWAGLLHLVKFYKSRRFDDNMGLPRPNDFHDFPEYFVLEAIPHAIAMVRAADKKSPREAVEFVLQLLKYNDNNGNPYSDVYWLAALVHSVGELEFGHQSISILSSLLKRIDRLLQFDRLMPSYNGILTISCIRSLTQIALKLSSSIPLDQVSELIKPFRVVGISWKVRIEASRALLDLEFHCNGIDAALLLFTRYVDEEASLRGQAKLAVHALRLCQIRCGSEVEEDEIKSSTLVILLRLLDSRKCFHNVFLRHHLFCLLQTLAGRPPTLYGVSRTHIRPTSVETENGNIQINDGPTVESIEPYIPPEPVVNVEPSVPDIVPILDPPKEADTISTGSERRRPVVKIRVRHSTASSRADETENRVSVSRGVHDETDRGGGSSCSMSVDAPIRISDDPINVDNNGQNNLEEVNSCHDRDSSASVKIINNDLHCTADSSKVEDKSSSPYFNNNGVDLEAQKYASLQSLTTDPKSSHEKEKKKKKDKDKKRKRDDPEYLEKKRLKKEKKQREKELKKLRNKDPRTDPVNHASVMQSNDTVVTGAVKSNDIVVARAVNHANDTVVAGASVEVQRSEVAELRRTSVEVKQDEPSGSRVVTTTVEGKGDASVHKIRIKIKKRNN